MAAATCQILFVKIPVPANRPTTRPVEDPAQRDARWMIGLRYVLPVAIVLGGAIVMAFGSDVDLEGGAGIVSAGLAVFGMNWLYRASIEGDREREEEEAARTYLDVHGHWPDEALTATARQGHEGSEPRVMLDVGATSKTPDAQVPRGERSRSADHAGTHSARSHTRSQLTRAARG